MTLSGIQVDGLLSVTNTSLDGLSTHAVAGASTFKEITTSRPADPQAVTMPSIYIQVDADLNSHLTYHSNPSGGVTPSDDSYSFAEMVLSSGSAVGSAVTAYNPKLNLPILDGGGGAAY